MAVSALFEKTIKEPTELESLFPYALDQDIGNNRINATIADPQSGMLQLVPGDFRGNLRDDFAMYFDTQNSKVIFPGLIKSGVRSIDIAESTANKLMAEAIKNSYVSDSNGLTRLKNVHLAIALCSVGSFGGLVARGFLDGNSMQGYGFLAAGALMAIGSWLQLKRS